MDKIQSATSVYSKIDVGINLRSKYGVKITVFIIRVSNSISIAQGFYSFAEKSYIV